jgi:hypothetical protein
MIKYLIAILLIAGSLHAEGSWEEYRRLKAQSFESVSLTVKNYIDMATVAKELKRPDIEAWSYNNAAYELINEFRRVTNYDKYNTDIANAPTRKNAMGINPRALLREEFRETLRNHKQLITDASSYIQAAVSVAYRPETDSFIDKKLGKKIKSNDGFIMWVLKFTETN